MQVWQDLQDLQSAYFWCPNLSFGRSVSSILEASGTIWAPLGLHFGAPKASLCSQGGLEGPRVEIDDILAPIWVPFGGNFGASGPTI